MTDQATKHAPPPAESQGRQRPARLLLGWMNQELAERALAAPGTDHPGPDQIARIVSARSAVAGRPPFAEQRDVVTPATAPLAEYEKALRTRAPAKPYFDEGWMVRVVDLTQVVAMQPQVFTDNAQARVVGVAADDLIATAGITLPLDGDVRLSVQSDEAQLTWLIGSDNPNLRVLGMHGQSTPNGVTAFGFQVGASLSYMQVAKYGDRYILRDGYHRAVAFLRAGIRTIPAFVREYDTLENLVPPGMLAQRQFLGEHPPLIADYLDDEVSIDVSAQAGRKVVFITVRELMQVS